MDEDDAAFFDRDGDKVIKECFDAIHDDNHWNVRKMPDRFRDFVVNSVSAAFRWPSTDRMGHVFTYLWEQYACNVKTNLTTHCKNRLTKFFRMRAYELNDMLTNDPLHRYANVLDRPFNEYDVKNAVNYTYHRRDSTRDDGERQRLGILLDELRVFDVPYDCNIRDFVQEHWFRSLRLWLDIQFDIDRFHEMYAERYDAWNVYHKHRKNRRNLVQPPVPEPPKIRNFAAIPMCTFQRRHIRVDTDVLYRLACETKAIPQKIGLRKKNPWRNITVKEFFANQRGSWGLYFDLEKIDAMVKGKKQFDHQIATDGVSASVLYLRPIKCEAPIPDEEVLRRYHAGEFYYELGIDPGMRTWNATVRRDIRTGEEVSEVK